MDEDSNEEDREVQVLDDNPRPTQRQRIVSEPYDNSLSNHIIFRDRNFS